MTPQDARPGLHGAGAVKLTLLYGAAQAIPLLVAPALTRLYSPEDLGQLSIFVALLVIGASAASLRFDQVVVVAKTRQHALDATVLALVCAAAVAAAAELAMAAGGHRAVAGFFGERARTWSIFLGFCLLLAAVALIASGWLLRNERFGAVGIVRLGQTGVVAVLAVVFGIAGVPQGLIAAQVAGLVLTGTVTGVMLSRDVAASRWPRTKRLCGLARRYWSFPVKSAPASFLNTLGLYLPLLLFARIFGELENGYFALARQCLLAVSGVLAVSTSQAFMLAATQCVHNGSPLRPLLLRQLARQGAVALAFLIGAVVFAQLFFGWFFGASWVTAGTYATWLAFPAAVALLVSPVSGLLLAVERLGMNSAWQVGHVLCMAALALPAYGGPGEFLAALLLVDAVCYGIYLALIVYSAGKHDRVLPRA